MKSRSARTDSDSLSSAYIRPKRGFELSDARTGRKPAAFENLADRFHLVFANGRAVKWQEFRLSRRRTPAFRGKPHDSS